MTLLCLAAIWLGGFGLLRWLFPRPLRWSLHNVLLFSLAIGLGAGVASCLYFLALWLAGPSLAVLASTTGAALAIALALGFLTKGKGPQFNWADGPPVPWYLTALLLLAAAVALAMFLGAVSFNPHGDEGAWSIWNLRARFLVRAGGFWRDAFSSDLRWTHPDYPLLLPGLVALCWKLSGRQSTDAPIAIAFLFTLGTAILLMSTLAVLRSKTHAALAGTLLLGTASFIGLSAALYGDVPLSFYILATLALLCLQDHYPEYPLTVLAGLMAGFAAWTRNEGLIFLAAVILARAFALFRSSQRAAIAPQVLRFLAGAAAPLAVLAVFKVRVAGPSELWGAPAATILKHLVDPSRWIVTLEGLLLILVNFGRFLIPIVLALALYWYLVRFRPDARDRAALSTAAGALVLTLAVQLLLDILFVDNISVEVATAFERILLQLWPAALLAFFLASAPLQLVAPNAPHAKPQKKTQKPVRRVAETR